MAAPAPHPFDREDINEHLVIFADDSKTLACMALVCPAWWRAARRAAGYRLRALAGHTGLERRVSIGKASQNRRREMMAPECMRRNHFFMRNVSS